MNNRTPQMVAAIKTWTEERDGLLREIGNYSNQLNELKTSTAAEMASLTDLQVQIADTRGRLAELTALEERMRTSLPIDIAEFIARKSRLESECETKAAELKAATEKYDVIVSATAELSAAHDVMKDQAAIVNSVVGELIQTSQVHLSDSKGLMAEIKTIADEVISKGNENVKQTGIVLEKLPRYIFELQKPIPLRRTFHAPRGATIEPETKN